ncbi:hypothetical protein [Marinigracilibium pacificum]|uniref:Outer membrane protein beta-barrel domain-containing protein n=1 Tax=Marinigracilibium pacificum TaxID=2729599 RepID=A0A848J0Z0_9BACT|nr:hypothetical protein [Marinigracilibium pacificum]NMM47959.1 hypothetical protein [Marinigracilibium pacificum]
MRKITFIFCLIWILYPNQIKAQIDWQPDFVNLQYAGNFGMISFGGGYELLSVEKPSYLNLGFYFGYLPEKVGGIEEYSANLKLTYIPNVRVRLSNRFDLNFLTTGMFVNYAFGNDHFTRWSERYPNGYYWWVPSIRIGVFTGGGINLKMKGSNRDFINFYYEFSTHDLELISYIQNPDYLSPIKIFNLSLGAIIYLK